MTNSVKFLKLVRQIHLYLGVFISPALLFFAFTGALQTINLHETIQGSSYKPPAWIMHLAQLHKKQTIDLPTRRPHFDSPPPAAAAQPDQPAASGPPPTQKNHIPMKVFFLLVSLGLFTSTLTGIYMSYKYRGSKLAITLLLVAGIVVPLLLIPI